jgi:serine/threonine protein kinase
MLDLGWSRKKLADKSHQSLTTINRIFEQTGLRPSTAEKVATSVGCRVTELLAPYDPRYQAPATGSGPGVGNSEWQVEAYLDQGRLTPNGLYYIACRLRHRFTTQRLGRGKYFHLSWLRPNSRELIQHQLLRHAEVSARVRPHPHLTRTVSSQPTPSNDGWWLVDEWVGAETLAAQLGNGPLSTDIARTHLYALAQALQKLHAAQVVLRELSPARILLAESDGRAVVTDFELAKLLDGPVSVSRDWPIDPYLAPEVQGSTATTRSDLYSFGRIAAAMFGGLPAMLANDERCLRESGLPASLKSLLVKCVAADPALRPESIELLLNALLRAVK